MNFKTVLFFVFIVGYVTACLDYCPEECIDSGCNLWVCESEFDCFCDDCDWYGGQLALSELARVKKDVIRAKLNTKK
ncbi:hypothetical protein GCK72_017197 [Caenorhabditis remanei]|uniref:Uncharacterized protein n=1 Tax=Caenorhabditis remanei TaxID=31234 RepID=A0A6A5G733_CAERE|nr:hypothetical protein GCK72_017197 [Caenorhabditis remanei]KAF1750646.1 hypothetical protein GCK72_017197 [Caenorhabditis remanei]